MPAEPNNQYARKYDEAEIEKLCTDLLEWSTNTKDIHFSGWAIKQNKSTSWINWLANTYPKFAETKEEAKARLARKILNSSFYDKSVNAYVGMQYIGIYDDQFKEFMKFKAQLQKKDSDNDKEIIIRRVGN